MNIERDRPARIINVSEAADLLKVSTQRVRAMIAAGQLPAEKIGRDWLIKAVDLYPLYDRKPGRPRKAQTPTPQLAQPAAALLRTLSAEREPVATIYRRLNWGRQKLEQTITAHRAELERAGLRLHVATHDAASGRQERYITLDGTRYSHLSQSGPPTA